MRFSDTKIPGVILVEPELREDPRGFFARIFCREEFRSHGLVDHIEQSSLSFNQRRGTVRGMHFQLAPYAETKVVACVEGRVFDVAVDARPSSPAFGQWFGIELSSENHRQLYLPAGIAHGFQTLDDRSTVLYQISTPFHAEAARGIRWNDPKLAIAWPIPDDVIVSEKDRAWPDWPQVTSELV
jgi:dTDP-4-dehydrorhamnose 3,5-epimerase